jgi:hypothetical protein
VKRIDFGALLLVFISVASVFCYFAVGERPRGMVSGKVTLDGKPLPGGLVSILDVECQTRSGGISKDGTYSVSNIVPGKAKVAVLTIPERSLLKNLQARLLRRFVAFPRKSADMNRSGLSLEVQTGPQNHDIQLKGEPELQPDWFVFWPWVGPVGFLVLLIRLFMW